MLPARTVGTWIPRRRIRDRIRATVRRPQLNRRRALATNDRATRTRLADAPHDRDCVERATGEPALAMAGSASGAPRP